MAKRDNRITLVTRVASLSEATELVTGRLDDRLVARAQQVVDRVDRRLAFAGNDTVIALAGATGSGKSSLFNALSGTRLAEPGLKRPTTNRAMAAYWGEELPNELLDWLDIPRRHLVQGDDAILGGLVLMDLTDHDSTDQGHRREVDRLVEQVDMLIWVVDPQKYADAALHDNYLKRLAGYAEVMLVVLNQADRLTPDQLRQAMRDLRRLLDTEGLSATQLVAASALTGMGIEALRKTISATVRNKQTAAARLAADVGMVARELQAELGVEQVSRKVSDARARALNESLAKAAGVELVKEAVTASMRHRGTLATGWPVTAWVSRFRPDPLRLLHLDQPLGGKRKTPELAPVGVQRTSLPKLGGVPQARVDSALRGLAEQAARGMPDRWARRIRGATLTHRELLPDELDRAVATTDLAMDRGQGWWQVMRIVQWIIFGVAMVGGLWLVANLLLAYLQLPSVPSPRLGRLPLPTLLLLGGGLAGLLAGLGSRVGVEAGARAKAARAERVLVRSVTEVADRLVIAPVNEELRRFHEARLALEEAAG